jgi:glycosyltransferase involved in cell wall biosynthesis
MGAPRGFADDVQGIAAFVRISSRPIPRVQRLMGLAASIGYQPMFVGAKREPGLPLVDVWEGCEVRRIGITFPLLNGQRLHVYVCAIIAFNVAVLRMLWNVRPRLVHCSDIEPYAACWLYARVHKARLVYNIHDNVAQRYALPAFIRTALNAVEGVAITGADSTAVPEEFRRDALPRWAREQVVVVRNTPEDPGCTEIGEGPVHRVVVFFGGWIDWGRGLQQLLDLPSVDPRISVRIAGEGRGDIISAVAGASGVEYLGYLPHSEIIEESRRADYIAALYDPARIINRFAASNKIAEALAVGRPVVVNEEVAVAAYLREQQCSIQMRYGRLADEAAGLVSLRMDIGRYREICRNARAAYDADYSWERSVSHAAARFLTA